MVIDANHLPIREHGQGRNNSRELMNSRALVRWRRI